MAHHASYSADYFAQSLNPSEDLGNIGYDSLDIAESATKAPLRVHVERVVREYFAALGDEMPTDLYDLILKEVELPLLTVVLEHTRGNQTKCAKILGLNRGTLRKKLKTYDLMD